MEQFRIILSETQILNTDNSMLSIMLPYLRDLHSLKPQWVSKENTVKLGYYEL